MYILSEIIKQGKTNQQCSSQNGAWIPARWKTEADYSVIERMKNAWAVLMKKADAVIWK